MDFDDKIIDASMQMATSLLEKQKGEFHPFALGVDSNNKIFSVNTYLGEEFPSSLKVIEKLKEALSFSHKENNFKGVTITTNVLYTPNEHTMKSDAIEIKVAYKINDKESYVFNLYKTFEIKKKKVIFKDEFLEEGDLLFF